MPTWGADGRYTRLVEDHGSALLRLAIMLTDAVPGTLYDEPGFLRHDDLRDFFELVQRLPDRQRETLVLRYAADFDDAAIAKIEGVSVHTVRSQAQLALEKLRASDAVSSREEES